MIMTSLDWVEGCSDSRTPEEHSRPTPLKHLLLVTRNHADFVDVLPRRSWPTGLLILQTHRDGR